MNKILSMCLLTFGLITAAQAQVGNGAITMSNDPAKAAAVERHAQELQAHQTPAAHMGGMHAMKHKAMHHAKHADAKMSAKP